MNEREWQAAREADARGKAALRRVQTETHAERVLRMAEFKMETLRQNVYHREKLKQIEARLDEVIRRCRIGWVDKK